MIFEPAALKFVRRHVPELWTPIGWRFGFKLRDKKWLFLCWQVGLMECDSSSETFGTLSITLIYKVCQVRRDAQQDY